MSFSFEDLINNPNYYLVVQNGTALMDYFAQATTNKEAAEIWSRGIENPEAVKLLPEVKDLEIELLADSNAVLFDTEIRPALAFDSYPCEIIMSKSSYMEGSTSWALQKNSELLSAFNYQVSSICRRYCCHFIREF